MTYFQKPGFDWNAYLELRGTNEGACPRRRRGDGIHAVAREAGAANEGEWMPNLLLLFWGVYILRAARSLALSAAQLAKVSKKDLKKFEFPHDLEGSFSAVSMPIFASKHSFLRQFSKPLSSFYKSNIVNSARVWNFSRVIL